jgi:hypothetical protein
MQTVATVKAWLTTCDHAPNHEHCRPRLLYQLPTRLLELRTSDSNVSVRLGGTSDFNSPYPDKPYKYIALSHCWGPEGSARLITTKDTIEQWSNGIPWADIPRTFRDAMSFSLKLGISYIWIDSLCIVQVWLAYVPQSCVMSGEGKGKGEMVHVLH